MKSNMHEGRKAAKLRMLERRKNPKKERYGEAP